jgi:hypothetical protein
MAYGSIVEAIRQVSPPGLADVNWGALAGGDGLFSDGDFPGQDLAGISPSERGVSSEPAEVITVRARLRG